MSAFDSITATLRQKALSQAPGEKLLSVRGLMKRYGASLYSVNAALRQLAMEGLIDVRKGSGIYISPQKGVRYIELHRPQYPSEAMDVKELSLGRAIAKVGWKMLTKRHLVHCDDPDMLPNAKTNAHVVMPTIFESNPSFFNHVLNQSAPVLAYGRVAGPFQLDYVTGDDHQYLSLLVKHLLSLGHRRLAFLANEPGFFPIIQRTEIFLNMMDLFELPEPTVIHCQTQASENSMFKAYEGLKKHLGNSCQKPKFTALISASTAGVLGALRAFHEAGLNVPRDCSLASFGIQSENSLYTPSVTEAGADDDAWGDGAVQVLKQRFEHPEAPPISLKLPPKLFVRESTAPARTANKR